MVSNEKADFRGALATELGMSAELAAVHPSLEEWIAYHEGGLDPIREKRLQSHLMGCPVCREVVIELDAFDAVQDEAVAAGISPRVDAASLALADAVRERAGEGEAGTPAGWSPGLDTGRSGLLRLAAPVLVLLTLASVGWSIYLHGKMTELQSRLARVESPTAGTLIADLYPPSVRREGGEDPTPEDPSFVSIPPGTDLVTWVLHLPPASGSPTYRAELRDAAGEVLWRSETLTADPRTHTVLLTTPRPGLPDGRYVLRILEGELGAETVAVEYPLEVAAP